MAIDSELPYHEPGETRSPTNDPRVPRSQKMELRLSPEELRILKECNRESFYYRSLPFAIAAMAATHIAVKKGFLSAHPKWGSSLKQIGAGAVGWFLGKLSYRSACEEKFLNLQNSSLGDAIRRKRGISSETYSSKEYGNVNLSIDNAPGYYPEKDFNSSSGSLNLDTDKNVQYSGLDDRGRPTTDSTTDLTLEDKPLRPSTSYEELRRKNRDNSENQFRPRQSSTLPPIFPPSRPLDGYTSKNRQAGTRKEGSPSVKNEYGDDTWAK